MKRPSDILVAIQDGRWGGAIARARAVADRWAAAAWLAARRGDGERADPALARDALEAALLPAGAKVRMVGAAGETALPTATGRPRGAPASPAAPRPPRRRRPAARPGLSGRGRARPQRPAAGPAASGRG